MFQMDENELVSSAFDSCNLKEVVCCLKQPVSCLLGQLEQIEPEDLILRSDLNPVICQGSLVHIGLCHLPGQFLVSIFPCWGPEKGDQSK